MRRRRFAAGLRCAPLLLAAMAARPAAVNPDELATCAAIAAGGARLACYDSLAAKSAGRSQAGAAAGDTAATTPVPTASSTPSPAGVTPTGAGSPAPAAPTAIGGRAAAAAPDNFAENDPKNFGFTRAQLHEVAPGPSAIQARIVNTYQDQPGHTVIVLDLGQTWTCTDDDGRLSTGDQVTIKRGAMASYSMLTAAHHIYKVHRVQ